MDLRKLFYRGGCPLCLETEGSRLALCDDCKDALSYYGQPLEKGDLIVYPLLAENPPAGKMIQGLKYRRERYWAAVLADLSAEFLFAANLRAFDGLVPVPTTAKKRRLRGYNPPGEIAKALAALTDIPVADVLSLRRRVRDQIGLSARERAGNVRDAFTALPVEGRLLLIDDTYTTGATLAACAEALYAAGAKSVTGFVMVRARTVREP